MDNITESSDYEKRVQAYEDKGLTRSDAQGAVDAEEMNKAPARTPEQWSVSLAIGVSTGLVSYQINDGMQNKEQAKANACLMASAPELLEALENAQKRMQYIEQHSVVPDEFRKSIGMNTRAIAKAKGE